MKSYNHLYEKLVSDENIKLAIKNSSLGKRNRKEVIAVLSDIDSSIARYRNLIDGYKNAKHVPKLIYDGISRKQRTIIVPTYDEQVVHHMIVNVLKPIFMKSMYEHSYGSIPNRGAHKASKYIVKWLTHDVKGTKYCLKMDVRKYFESIPHDILKLKLSNLIHDERFLNVLFEVIDVIPNGIPLGFYTSQWLANYYLTELDHYVKEILKAEYYVRYMDDMVALGGNKRQLHFIRVCISNYLSNELGLKMKDNWQVFRIEYGKGNGRPIDFLGFKFYRNKTVLRKKIMQKMTRKALKIYRKVKPTIYDCKQFLSYLGWLKATDVYNVYLNYIKPYIDIRYIKRRISNYDRRKNRLCGMNQNLQLCL